MSRTVIIVKVRRAKGEEAMGATDWRALIGRSEDVASVEALTAKETEGVGAEDR